MKQMVDEMLSATMIITHRNTNNYFWNILL